MLNLNEVSHRPQRVSGPAERRMDALQQHH
jgi:hypothetical protein